MSDFVRQRISGVQYRPSHNAKRIALERGQKSMHRLGDSSLWVGCIGSFDQCHDISTHLVSARMDTVQITVRGGYQSNNISANSRGVITCRISSFYVIHGFNPHESKSMV